MSAYATLCCRFDAAVIRAPRYYAAFSILRCHEKKGVQVFCRYTYAVRTGATALMPLRCTPARVKAAPHAFSL